MRLSFLKGPLRNGDRDHVVPSSPREVSELTPHSSSPSSKKPNPRFIPPPALFLQKPPPNERCSIGGFIVRLPSKPNGSREPLLSGGVLGQPPRRATGCRWRSGS